jgi:hypothetical protein
MAYKVMYTPEDVPVSDDRGTVPGAYVIITMPDGGEVSGEIIPVEGRHPDCWAGELSWADEELMDLLQSAAERGAEGRSGSITSD